MVKNAWSVLVEGWEESDTDQQFNEDGTENVFRGISACTKENHIHVKCNTQFIRQLLDLAEFDRDGLLQERHAKTLELAQKEILICISLTLFNRLENIQQKLLEAEQTCNLLFLVCLKALRRSLETAAENKRGMSDIELLCQQLDDQNERKKANKRARKQKARAKKQENKNTISSEICEDIDNKENISGLGNTHSDSVEDLKDSNKEIGPSKPYTPRLVNVPLASKCNASPKKITETMDHTWQNKNDNSVKDFGPLSFTRSLVPSLLDMLENEEFTKSGGEEIPLEDIRSFLDNLQEVMDRRQKLRANLKQKFAAFCAKCNGTNCIH